MERSDGKMKDIIVGCGHLGAGLAMHLQQKGHEVTIIDKKEEAFKKLPGHFNGTSIVGFGFDQEVLESANFHMVDAVIACTNDDETNALIARIAKNKYQVPAVIAHISDPRKGHIYQSFGIQTISPIMWGIEKVAELLSYDQLDRIWVTENGEVGMIRIETPPLLAGYQVNELRRVGEIEVMTIVRNNRAFIPVSGTILEPDDIIYVVVVTAALDHLKTMLS